MKYQFIDDHRSSLRVMKMCQALKVSSSGYYDWRSRPESKRSRDNRILLSHIRIAFKKSRKNYGSPRVTDELNESGIPCGENRVARHSCGRSCLSRLNGIGVTCRPCPTYTYVSGHNPVGTGSRPDTTVREVFQHSPSGGLCIFT